MSIHTKLSEMHSTSTVGSIIRFYFLLAAGFLFLAASLLLGLDLAGFFGKSAFIGGWLGGILLTVTAVLAYYLLSLCREAFVELTAFGYPPYDEDDDDEYPYN